MRDSYNINISGKSIASTKSVTHLGLPIDRRLNFDLQLSKLCKKTAAKLSAVSKFSSFTNCSSKKALVEASVYSQYNYCHLVLLVNSK